MTNILKNLENITTKYSVFEKDQVLTHEQLNSIADYLDDQTRLTRVKLLGVGIVCGLRVSLQENTVQVTKGVGVTTDGDLLYFNNDIIFDRFKLYDKSYPPFYVNGDVNGKMIDVYELVSQNTTDEDERATALSQFNSEPEKNLNNMVAVLLMESYEKDDDICSGTDCDNLGKDRINTIKLLLVDNQSLSLLKKTFSTPAQAYSGLNEVVADRAIIPLSINSLNQLANIYRTTCNAIYNKLIVELPKIYPNCQGFLADSFPSNPSNEWLTRLADIQRTFAANDSGIQYCYNFLKDVVETYNCFRELLFGEITGYYPDIESFPKHLLLGNLISSPDSDENRTGFYPAPTINQTSSQLGHAKFLVQKLNTLINTFQVPAASENTPIRITPSLFEDQDLEERAIPYYYEVNETNPIDKSWNYRLHQRGMDSRNYSYHAQDSNAEGAAANPLTSQIGRFSFFRIEGHLGQNISTALSLTEREITSKNLPFTVRSVLLGQDKTKIVKKPGIRYTDLHRLHYLLRQDAYHQLNEVARFSDKFKQEIDQNVTGESNATTFKIDAEQRNTIVTQNAASVAAKLNRSYPEYQADLSWQPELAQTVTAASQFKFNISDVVKTEFTTPFDTLISSTHTQWLNWLDEIIKKKDETEDEKLLFTNFISQNPGMEHFAGVVRGGTFVLVHDSENIVIADFMLPYYCEDKVETAPEEPPLTKPPIRSDFVIDKGIRVLPSFDKRLSGFKEVIEPELTKKFEQQSKYLEIYKGFVDTSTSIFTAVSNIKLQKFTDPLLDVQIREVEIEREKVGLLKQRANQPEDERANRAEVELAQSLVAITEYIATSGISVMAGSEGSKAMQIVSDSSVTINKQDARETLEKGLDEVTGRHDNNRELVAIIKSILSRR